MLIFSQRYIKYPRYTSRFFNFRKASATAPCRADAVAFALFRFRSRHNRKAQAEGFADFGDSVKRDIHTSFFDTAKVTGIKTAAVEAAPGPKKESDE